MQFVPFIYVSWLKILNHYRKANLIVIQISLIWDEENLQFSFVDQSVQVMGTFDGWSQGEHLSPEYTGSFTKFSATLMLRPGRYRST